MPFRLFYGYLIHICVLYLHFHLFIHSSSSLYLFIFIFSLFSIHLYLFSIFIFYSTIFIFIYSTFCTFFFSRFYFPPRSFYRTRYLFLTVLLNIFCTWHGFYFCTSSNNSYMMVTTFILHRG